MTVGHDNIAFMAKLLDRKLGTKCNLDISLMILFVDFIMNILMHPVYGCLGNDLIIKQSAFHCN